jgi:cytochrome c oxidase subunit 1
MVGGTLMAIMGGFYYWLPKMFGRMYSEGAARVACVLIFGGFNLTFFPQFILGSQGMPRRYFNYLPQFTDLNRLSSFGAFTIGIGFVWMAIYLAWALKKGAKASGNPWESMTLEWQSPSPPPLENFATTPTVTHGPYEYRPSKV